MVDTKSVVKIALAVLVVVIIFRMMRGSKAAAASSLPPEFFNDYDPSALGYETVPPAGATPQPGQGSTGPGVTDAPQPGVPVGPAMTLAPSCVSADLLPKPSASQGNFGEFAPTNPLASQNFLDASKLIGQDTVQSSLRNANYSLRKDPPITRINTGPFLASSIEPDLMRKPLDC